MIALVIAVVTGGSSTPTCALTSAAAGALVTGATKGRAVGEIVGPAAAGVGVPAACKPVVDALVNDPNEEVKLDVRLPDGSESTETLTGSQLPSAPPVPAQRSCLNWITPEWRRLCLEGRLPPVAPATAAQ